MVYLLILLSVSAFAFAGRVALAMVRERAETRDRIARACRPVHGGPVIRSAPARSHNRPGEN